MKLIFIISTLLIFSLTSCSHNNSGSAETTVESTDKIYSNSEVTAESLGSGTTPDNFNLMTIIKAFNKGGSDFWNQKEGQITETMKNLGFAFIGSSNYRIKRNDSWVSRQNSDTRQYTFKNDDLIIDVETIEYYTHIFIRQISLNFNDSEACDNFVRLSEEKANDKFYSTVEKTHIKIAKVSDKKVIITVDEDIY